MEKNNVYKNCPVLENETIYLKKLSMNDIEDLLECYSDKLAFPLFNSDNCNDDFYYDTREKMENAINFWIFAYDNGYFVRWTVFMKDTSKAIGTIEMFHGEKEDKAKFGVLRIDLNSKYEKKEIIKEILELANGFYDLFDVDYILTKVVPSASERLKAIKECDYEVDKLNIIPFDFYYGKYFR